MIVGTFFQIPSWVVATQTFLKFSPRFFGEMIQFDEHIFQMGWFNHQLVEGGRGKGAHKKRIFLCVFFFCLEKLTYCGRVAAIFPTRYGNTVKALMRTADTVTLIQRCKACPFNYFTNGPLLSVIIQCEPLFGQGPIGFPPSPDAIAIARIVFVILRASFWDLYFFTGILGGEVCQGVY